MIYKKMNDERAYGEREVLPERVALEAWDEAQLKSNVNVAAEMIRTVVGHDTTQVWVTLEEDAKQIICLPLIPECIPFSVNTRVVSKNHKRYRAFKGLTNPHP